MHIILRIFKEIGIAIAILILLLVAGFFLFKSSVPFLNSDIPHSVEYKGIDMAQFDIEGDLENQKDPTKTYEATNGSLRTLEQDRRIHTGAPNPFVSTSAEPDIPTERVSISNSANPTEEELAKMAGNTDDSEAQTDTSTETSTEGTVNTSYEPSERSLEL